MNKDAGPAAQRAPAAAQTPKCTVRVDSIDSSAILQGRDAISIVHRGELYRLRATRQGKLILTK